MRRILITLALLASLSLCGSDAMAGGCCCCCKPPKLEKMTAPPHKCCLASCCCCCCKKQEKVGEAYLGKGNGVEPGPCCEPPPEHHRLFHKCCK
jgi:hypothetical protein